MRSGQQDIHNGLASRNLFADPGLEPGTLSYLEMVLTLPIYGVNLSLLLLFTIVQHTRSRN